MEGLLSTGPTPSSSATLSDVFVGVIGGVVCDYHSSGGLSAITR